MGAAHILSLLMSRFTVHDLAATIDGVMAEQADVVAAIRGGKEASFKFLVGRVMKVTQGRANPAAVNRLLREKIDAGQ